MKRKDINVGDELFYARPGDWNYDKGSYPAERVRVVSVSPYHQTDFGRGPMPGGNGVLVEVLDVETGKPGEPYRWGNNRYAVNIMFLRGPYAETAAMLAARREEKSAARRGISERRKAVSAAVATVVNRARLDGWSSVHDVTSWEATEVRNARVSISLADFERMLNKIDELGNAVQEFIGEADAEGE